MSYKVELKEALSKSKDIVQHSVSSCVSKEENQSPLKLPKIVLPSFSGEY